MISTAYFKKMPTAEKAALASLSSSPLLSLLSVPEKTYTVLPGFCDVHVHFREPGFSYKETIASGSRAAAHGGYTTVLAMPNLSPVPDSPEHLAVETEIIRRDAVIDVLPYGSLTVGEKGKEPADIEGMKDAVAFSDDGKGVQSEEMMRSLMKKVRGLGKVLVAHCEDEALVRGGVIHDGKFAKANGLPGICSESEWGPIERDLRLAEETGCPYHVCHISCRESVELIRKAKARGVNVTCETAPHYLLLTEDALKDEGRFKMNPPIRSQADRDALIEGLADGTVDMVATDHAPHSAEEKSRGLLGSPFGIVGIETAFPLLYTYLVRTGKISMERLLDSLVTRPRERFGLPLLPGSFSIWDLEADETVRPDTFLSGGKATPFEGYPVSARLIATCHRGKEVYTDPAFAGKSN